MATPIIEAAREFLSDEARRAKRRQKVRMPQRNRTAVRAFISRVERHALVAGRRPADGAAERGRAAVELFGYADTFDENAATVIADILHAVAAAGYSPSDVGYRARVYQAEESGKSTPLIPIPILGPETCEVYWGSHGCRLPRGHDPEVTPHECDCCECPDHAADNRDAEYDNVYCVGKPPYYGPETVFYGEDA